MSFLFFDKKIFLFEKKTLIVIKKNFQNFFFITIM